MSNLAPKICLESKQTVNLNTHCPSFWGLYTLNLWAVGLKRKTFYGFLRQNSPKERDTRSQTTKNKKLMSLTVVQKATNWWSWRKKRNKDVEDKQQEIRVIYKSQSCISWASPKGSLADWVGCGFIRRNQS